MPQHDAVWVRQIGTKGCSNLVQKIGVVVFQYIVVMQMRWDQGSILWI